MLEEKSPYDVNIRKLFTNAREKKFPKNQIICYQGDPLSHIYLLKTGYIKAYTILDSGDTRTLFILGPGDLFPIAFSLTLDWEKYHLRYFYQSLTDTSMCLLDHQEFKRSLENNRDKMNAYLSYMSASNQQMINQLEIMKNKKAISKISLILPYLILKLGEPVNDNTYRLKLKLSHQEIADLTGLTRETAAQLIKKLENKGVIKQKRNTWIINSKLDLDDILQG